MTTRYDKAEVHYTDDGHRDAHCSICRHWRGDGRCEIVSGKVAPGGWCDHFKRRNDAAR